MEEEYDFYIFSAEKLATFCKEELEAIASVHELKNKLATIGMGCNEINKECIAKLKASMPETIAVIKSGFFKEGDLAEITSRFRDALYQIEKSLGEINEIAPIAAFETLSFAEALKTIDKKEKAKKPATHNKYKKREFHRRFF